VRFNELDAAGGLRDKAIMRQKRGNAGNLEVDISAGIGDTLKTDLFLNEYPAACCGWDGQETDLRKTAYLHLDD